MNEGRRTIPRFVPADDAQAVSAPGLPTLLVVDDTPEYLMILGEILSPEYRVRVASHGAAAVEFARQAPAPDLILLDVLMPGMSGYETLAALKSDPRTADIPVIFVTSLDAWKIVASLPVNPSGVGRACTWRCPALASARWR